MIWSHPHDGWFYLELAVGLGGLLALSTEWVFRRRKGLA